MSVSLIIEILATCCSLIYIIFLMKEKIICWPFGIAGSLLSIYLFIDAKLYSEAVLFLFYVAMGIWGWLRWHQRAATDANPIIQWIPKTHLWGIIAASSFALITAHSFQTFTDAERPYLDAFTTAFSFLATYMQVTKVLENWFYWIVLNLVSIWLYQDRSLDIYAAVVVVYSALSVWGFINWRNAYRQQTPISL